MAGIYVYSDKETLMNELIGFAKTTGRPVNVVSLNASAEGIYGADKVFLLRGESELAENYAKPIAEFLKSEGAELFLVGATPRGRDIAARVAGYLKCAMVSDVSAISLENGKVKTERMMFGGAVVQSEIIQGMGVITVPAGKFEAAAGAPGEIINIQVNADTRVSLREKAPIVRDGVDLTVAEKIVCIGMGMENKEDMKIAVDLAKALGAEIGCTRSIAEEKQWLSQYIGISGMTVKPNLYLSLGVSGQIQHVSGIRDSKIIAAIDINEKAPIFTAADYGIVGDMFEIVPLLVQELKNA
jgi:electron transfer flavoprotein alpha subunit